MPPSDIITLQSLSEKLSQWRQPGSNELYAIVDMGSNGIRFSITSLAPPFSRLLSPIFAKRAAISLFDALKPSPSGLIFPDKTIEEVADTLAGFYRLAIAHHVIPQHMFVFATEAMRRADNAGKMLSAISDATDGLGVQILEPTVETLFGAVMGSRSGVADVPKGALFLDLGGGSVQMTWVDTSVDDYELKAATAGSSMPYGAAKTMRIFEELAVQQQQVEIGNLHSGMKTVYGVLCSQFTALNAIKTAYEKGEDAKVDVYMCGGGFRGYGHMLMHSDSISPYPIASTHTYVADGAHFKQTAKMLEINQEYDGKIFGLSKRRRQQFPAIITVLDAFITAVPNIGQVTFCGGSNREGALMMMLPKGVRESNPMEVLANLKEDERCVLDAALELLRGSVPPDVPLAGIPTILIHGLGYLFVQQIWKRRGYKSEINSSFALHDAIQRNSECPGLTHLARALLGLTLCSYWDGKLTEADSKLYDGLCGIVRRHNPQSTFWSQYLAAIAMTIVEVVPVAPVSPAELLRALKFESNLDGTEEKSVVVLRIGIATDYIKGIDIASLTESIKSRTKNKTEPGPSKVKVQIYTRSQQ